ncbi:hypothetical protein B0T20DRAFT_349622, partial [Sordaria brevicollis]
NLEPYFADGLYNIKISNELLAHLYTEYYDYNCKEKAIYKFNDLKFEINSNF